MLSETDTRINNTPYKIAIAELLKEFEEMCTYSTDAKQHVHHRSGS